MKDAESGELVEPKYHYSPGIISHPEEFECAITVRGDKARELLRGVEEEVGWEKSGAEELKSI